MLGEVRHRLNNKYPTEVLAVLVSVLGMTVAGMSGGGQDFRVLAAAVSPLSLSGGQSVVVNCGGARLTVARQNSRQVTLNCLVSPTVVPTPTVPTVAPTVAPTTTPQPVPTRPVATITPTPTVTGGGHHTGGSGVLGADSMAMMAWGVGGKNAPNSKYDRCDDGTNIVEAHKRFFVIGPDGKKYPTWHPPVVTNPVTGVGRCYFGHEHGRDPKGYAFWDEIRRHFAFDSDKDGQISAGELASSGIPFGYVNEQMDLAGGVMRHEDHVGHKIEFANGEGDIGSGTDPFDSSLTGGVVAPVKTASGNPKWVASGVRCHHFHKIHQGVSTPDALTNNLHEAILHQRCVSTRGDFPASSATLLSGMIAFGAPGEFIRFCGQDRDQPVVLGTTEANRNYPGRRGDGMRNIITRDCVEKEVLVPEGQFSSFPYEIWSGSLRIVRPDGSLIAENGGGWEVLDAIRYYNPVSSNLISYTSSWCYEVLGGRRARGGTCDWMTDYGRIRDITWDDPRSGFRGINRGQYVEVHQINNSGGPEVWYTDWFGRNASRTPFTGSIKQRVSPVNARVSWSSDPRIIAREHDDGGRTVHAPN